MGAKSQQQRTLHHEKSIVRPVSTHSTTKLLVQKISITYRSKVCTWTIFSSLSNFGGIRSNVGHNGIYGIVRGEEWHFWLVWGSFWNLFLLCFWQDYSKVLSAIARTVTTTPRRDTHTQTNTVVVALFPVACWRCCRQLAALLCSIGRSTDTNILYPKNRNECKQRKITTRILVLVSCNATT